MNNTIRNCVTLTVRFAGRFSALAFGALLLAAAPSLAGDEKKAMSAQHEEMMKKMMEAGKPGPQHAMLANMAGKWKTTVKWWEDPTKPKDFKTSQGSAEMTSVLEGRFIMETHKGMMDKMPFEGFGLSGYDNMQKKYVSTWVDNMSTQIIMFTGSFDEATKTYSYSGGFIDPMTGKNKVMKTTCKVIDMNNTHNEFWDQKPDGKFVKTMEIKYTRDVAMAKPGK